MTLASRPIAYFCLGLSMTLVGSYVALSKPLALIFPVMLLAWLRFGIGAIAMLGWVKRPADEPRYPVKPAGCCFRVVLATFFSRSA